MNAFDKENTIHFIPIQQNKSKPFESRIPAIPQDKQAECLKNTNLFAELNLNICENKPESDNSKNILSKKKEGKRKLNAFMVSN